MLEEVNYFSAFATWRPDAHKRHIDYVKALSAVGVKCVMGHFKEKRKSCLSCGDNWIEHEEKETDVHLAARIVFDAFEDRYDRMILVTADSDLVPSLNLVRTRFPKKQLFVVAPPGRHGHARGLGANYTLTPGRLGQHLLPEHVLDEEGIVVATRPKSYDPPL